MIGFFILYQRSKAVRENVNSEIDKIYYKIF